MSIANVVANAAQTLGTVKPPEASTEAVQSGVAISRYRAGLTNLQELVGELTALGYSGLRMGHLVLSAQLGRQLDLFNDRLTLWRKQYTDGTLDTSQFSTLLEGAGLSPEAVSLEVSLHKPQKPATVVKSVQATIDILSVQQAPTPTPEAPVEITLAILAAQGIVEAGAGVRPVTVSLSILSAEPVVPPSLAQPVQVTLTLLEVLEV